MATFFAIILYLAGGFFILSGLILGSSLAVIGGFIIAALAGIFEMLFKIRAVIKVAAERPTVPWQGGPEPGTRNAGD